MSTVEWSAISRRWACPDGALLEEERTIGTVSIGRSENLEFISGTLDVGKVRAAPLIEGVLKHVDSLGGLTVVDAPPGTSCSAMAASSRADVLLLVTEPTPFGLHDLELAVGMGQPPNSAACERSFTADMDHYRENVVLGSRKPIEQGA